MTFEQIENELKTHYYLEVPFAMEQEAIDEAVEAFFLFLEEPDEVKSHIYFSVNPISRRGEAGYVRRDPESRPEGDCKEYFHYHGAILNRYPEFLEEHPAVKDFAEKALPIWQAPREKIISNMPDSKEAIWVYARWAVVCFFEARGMAADSIEETHQVAAKSQSLASHL